MDGETPPSISSASNFGPTHVVEPTTRHTHTAILLHGRGGTGEDFAEELLDSIGLTEETVAQRLPAWRWVFPSSKQLWSTTFEEELPAWFEAHSLTDVTARQDLQLPGIRESVQHLRAILNDEIVRLDGSADRVVLGGISQGAAIAIWVLLCRDIPARRLGAFVGASTWLPFAANVESFLSPSAISHDRNPRSTSLASSEADSFVEGMMGALRRTLPDPSVRRPFLSTPVFLGHGTDDAYVDIELGRQARHVLTQIGFEVEWREYDGADQEGHWLKVPEEVDGIVHFLSTCVLGNICACDPV
ncbi:Alpha/Beta hydrolase protein [Annulohypoxylon bovei var. microspora]|nr:Alpha/Beta hydrolase protein [Annulohypoxylon bovei var. microspora]